MVSAIIILLLASFCKEFFSSYWAFIFGVVIGVLLSG